MFFFSKNFPLAEKRKHRCLVRQGDCDRDCGLDSYIEWYSQQNESLVQLISFIIDTLHLIDNHALETQVCMFRRFDMSSPLDEKNPPEVHVPGDFTYNLQLLETNKWEAALLRGFDKAG